MLLLFFQLEISAAENVTLAWNSSTDPTIAGYNIYYGTASHNYANVVTVGNTNTVTISGLTAGTTYYFAASSYDLFGYESILSGEASYTMPEPKPELASTVFSGGQFSFTVSGTSGQSYVVEASTNLKDWIPLETNAVPFKFVEANAGNFRTHFFRAVTLIP